MGILAIGRSFSTVIEAGMRLGWCWFGLRRRYLIGRTPHEYPTTNPRSGGIFRVNEIHPCNIKD
jgi:hypothetical protein